MRYFEDLTVGETFRSESTTITETDIIEFGKTYDPLPFHIDPEAAKETFLNGLAASGIHTLAICEKLTVDGFLGDTAVAAGLELDDLMFPKPVRPGDSLTAYLEVVEKDTLESLPGQGLVRMEREMRNQDDEVVFAMTNVSLFDRRHADS